MIQSPVLLERISNLRKEFEERGAAIHGVLNPLREQGRWRQPDPVASLAEIFGACSPGEVERPRGLPSFLTTEARRLLDRGRRVLDRIRALDSRLVGRSGDSPALLGMALGELVRGLCGLPESAESQDGRCRGMSPFMGFLERATHELEVIHANRSTAIGHWGELVALFRDLAAWSDSGGISEMPAPDRLSGVIQCLTSVSQRPDWIDFLWLAPEAVPCRAEKIAAEGWNVGMLMLRGAAGVGALGGAPREDLALAGLLHDIGLLVGNAGHPGTAEAGYFETHGRRGGRLIERWIPRAVGAIAVARWHHSPLDGQETPGGLTEGGLAAWAELGSVAKCVAGILIRGGPFGEPLPLAAALDLVACQSNNGVLDPDVLLALGATVDWQPREVA